MQITTHPRRKDSIHKGLCDEMDLILIQHVVVSRISNVSQAGREVNITCQDLWEKERDILLGGGQCRALSNSHLTHE